MGGDDGCFVGNVDGTSVGDRDGNTVGCDVVGEPVGAVLGISDGNADCVGDILG